MEIGISSITCLIREHFHRRLLTKPPPEIAHDLQFRPDKNRDHFRITQCDSLSLSLSPSWISVWYRPAQPDVTLGSADAVYLTWHKCWCYQFTYYFPSSSFIGIFFSSFSRVLSPLTCIGLGEKTPSLERYIQCSYRAYPSKSQSPHPL